ncbi:MAG: hypothetical protein Kow0065_06510 [Methylomicrobium sp.]
MKPIVLIVLGFARLYPAYIWAFTILSLTSCVVRGLESNKIHHIRIQIGDTQSNQLDGGYIISEDDGNALLGLLY